MNLDVPFGVTHARALGVPRSRLRASDLRASYYGSRASAAPPAESAEESVHRRALEYTPVMRSSEFFCLVAAAVLWGAPLPLSILRPRNDAGENVDRALDVGVLLPARAARGRGVCGRTLKPGWGSVRTDPATGVRLTSPATTWAMMGELLGRDDLVALGDAFVREPMRRGDPAALAEISDLRAAAEVGRRRGVRTLREALPLIRTRSRSRKESETRLLLMSASMPEPELNVPVDVDGEVVALIDLAYPDVKLGFEYEGEHHLLDPTQWAIDIRRYEMLTELGWRVIRVTKSDLAAGRTAFVARAQSALAFATSRRARW